MPNVWSFALIILHLVTDNSPSPLHIVYFFLRYRVPISLRHNMAQKHVLYHYKPSFLAATAAMVLFANTTLFHLWQIYKHKTWYFIPFIIGGICKLEPASFTRDIFS